MGSKAPRKIYFIDRKFQAAFILKFILLLLVGTAIFDFAAYFILNKRLEDTLYSAHLTIKSVGDILLPTLVSLSAVFILLLGLAVLIMTLVVSHLIAGPLYAIRRYMDYISQGRLDFEARLRAKDQTTPLARSLSQSLDVLNTRITSLQGLSADLDSSSAQAAEYCAAPGSEEKLKAELERIHSISSKITDEISFFKTKDPSVDT